MKYSILIATLLATFLIGCGEPKPGQYPPSFMDDRESAPKQVAKYKAVCNNRLLILIDGCCLKAYLNTNTYRQFSYHFHKWSCFFNYLTQICIIKALRLCYDTLVNKNGRLND